MNELKYNVSEKTDIHYTLNTDLSNEIEKLVKGSKEQLYIILVAAIVKVIADYKNTDYVRVGIGKSIIIPTSISISAQMDFNKIIEQITIILDTNSGEDEPLDFTEFTIIHEQVNECNTYKNNLITINQDNGHISLTWNTFLCRKEIDSLQEVLELILNQAVKTLDKPLKDYNLIEPNKLNTYSIDRQGKKESLMTNKHIIESIYEVAVKYPNNKAVTTEKESLTYQELIIGIDKAAAFFEEIGICVQDKVGIIANRSIDAIVAIYGLLRIGASYVPIENDYPNERKRYILDNCKCKYVLNTFTSDKIFTNGINEIYLEKNWYIGKKIRYQGEFPKTDSTVYTIFTSGTTGYPKGVNIKNTWLINLCTWFVEETKMKREDNVLLLIPYCFDASVKNIFSPLIVGATLVLGPEILFDTYSVIKLIKSREVTHINCVPRLFYALMDTDMEKLEQNLSTVKYAVMGGESLEAKPLLPWAKSNLRLKVLNVYGPTECTSVSTFAEINKKTVLDNQVIPIGNPINNKIVYVLNRNNKLVPNYFQGELFLSGIGTARRYLLNHDKSINTVFQENRFCHGEIMYRTGDMVKWDENGQLIYLGRIDKQVKIQGHRVELQEIEQVLKQYYLIKEAVVLYRSSKKKDVLVAFIIGIEDSIDIELLNANIESILPNYMIPNKYILLKSFPVNLNGKVDNNQLIKMIDMHDHIENDKEIKEIEEDIHLIVHKIWSDLLEVDNIGYDINFFDAGGYSLLLYKLNKVLTKTFNINISFIDLMTYTTINELAERIKQLKICDESLYKTQKNRISDIKNKSKG